MGEAARLVRTARKQGPQPGAMQTTSLSGDAGNWPMKGCFRACGAFSGPFGCGCLSESKNRSKGRFWLCWDTQKVYACSREKALPCPSGHRGSVPPTPTTPSTFRGRCSAFAIKPKSCGRSGRFVRPWLRALIDICSRVQQNAAHDQNTFPPLTSIARVCAD